MAKAKKSTKDEPKNNTPSTPVTPAPAVTGSDPTTKKSGKPGGLLGSLLAKAKTPAPTTPAKKAKPTLRCETTEEITAFDTFTAADAILKIASGRQAAAKERAYAVMVRKHYKNALDLGYMPDNPLVQSDKSRATLAIKHVKKFKAVDPESGEPINVAASLAGLGFAEDAITDIVGSDTKEGILKVYPQLGLKKFTDLTADSASAPEKSAAEKIMQFVQDNLTDEEKEAVLVSEEVIEIDAMWQDKAVAMTNALLPKGTPDQKLNILMSLFRIIRPQIAMNGMNFSGELTESFGGMVKEHEKAMTEPQVLDIKPDGSDKTYRTKIIGKNVHLFLVKPDGAEEPLKTKECDDFGHAQASVKQWKRQPTVMMEFIAGTRG